MQTLVFTRALKEITRELKVSELSNLIMTWLNRASGSQAITDQSKNLFSRLLFESNAGFHQLRQKAVTGRILAAMRVEQFYEPSRLREMISAVSAASQHQNILNNWQHFSSLSSFAELLRGFHILSAGTIEILETERVGQPSPSNGIVELELIEYADQQGISPKRLQLFASGITQLHSQLAILHGIESDTLTFAYFDSGSSVLVGIQCAKAIAETMNTLFTQWWDKLIYLRYETFDKKVDAMSKGLALMETIHQSVEKGVITGEVGANLKIRVLREVNDLTQIGVTIPIEEDAPVNQLQLLTEVRNTKLLTDGGGAEEKRESSAGTVDLR